MQRQDFHSESIFYRSNINPCLLWIVLINIFSQNPLLFYLYFQNLFFQKYTREKNSPDQKKELPDLQSLFLCADNTLLLFAIRSHYRKRKRTAHFCCSLSSDRTRSFLLDQIELHMLHLWGEFFLQHFLLSYLRICQDNTC